MKTRIRFCAIILITLVLLSSCVSKANNFEVPQTITVQLKYFHQAQFAGFYVANQNGYYADEGLKINFIEGGPTVDLQKAVLEGSAQFGVTAPEQLIAARIEGKPLRAIAVIFRNNPAVFMTLVDSGITRPQDIVGKKVQYNATMGLVLNAMLANFGISSDAYTKVDVGYDLAAFYSGKVQVWNAFLTNEVLTARADGYKVNIINPDDYGIHFYSDTLYTTDDIIADNPDLVLRFLRATLKGWTFAVENPQLVAPMVAKYNTNANAEHETAQMLAGLPLINTGEDHIGWMKPEVWAGMEKTLREQGALTTPLDVTQVYTMQFLEEIYK